MDCLRIKRNTHRSRVVGFKVIEYIVAALSVMLLAVACQDSETPAAHPSLRTVNLPRLISAEEFYSASYESWEHQISPDGRKLAWIQWAKGKSRLHVRVLESGRLAVLKQPTSVIRFYWARDSRHLLFFAKTPDGKTGHLFLADTDSPATAPRDLTPFDEVSVRQIVTPLSKPESVLVGMNLSNNLTYDLYEINLETSQHKRIRTNHGRTSRWIVSREGRAIARLQNTRGGGWELQALDERGRWERVLFGTLEDSIAVVDNAPDDRPTVYMQTNTGRDKVVVLEVDLENGEQQVLFQSPDVDVSRFWIDPSTHEPLAFLYHDGFPRYHYYDRHLQQDIEGILDRGPMLYSFSSASTDYMLLTVQAETDRLGASTYLVDRRSGRKELLTAHPLAKHQAVLSVTRPIRFRARDGLPLSGYLTLPHGTDGRHLPTVLKVHGGPWMQDVWGFDLDTQFLANRGYAVLEVNFRGSSGFGKSFMDKARNEFGGKMQDDLYDAVDWAIAQGYADSEKVAVLGYSYGGYAALTCLTRTPRKFAAGINVMGMSDLTLQVKAFPPDSFGARAWWIRFVGDPDDPEVNNELIKRSPITYAGQIERPMLIVHGAKDARVLKEHSDRLVEKLRKRGVPVQYLVFQDEGHGISKIKNRIEFAHRLEAFLAKHLGGRALSP